MPSPSTPSECLTHKSVKCIRQLCDAIAVSSDVGFFVGAGISIRSPACLPSASDLKKAILSAVNPDVGSPSRFSALLQEIKGDQALTSKPERLSAMMLEHLLHLVDEVDDHPTADLVYQALKILDITQHDPWSRGPNQNHFVLAHLLLMEKTTALVTTNFDHLIEDAYFALSSTLLPGTVPTSIDTGLTKLHGDIRQRESIRTTLPRVVTPLQGPHRRRLEEIFARYCMCFLGYSGRDLDISVAIREATIPRSVYWLCKPGDGESNVRHIREMLRGKELHIIPCDLNRFLDAVGVSVGCPEQARDDQSHSAEMYSFHWESWRRSLSQWQKMFLVGRLYQEIGERADELAYYKASLGWSSSARERGLSEFRIGTAYLGSGHLIRAWWFLRRADAACRSDQSLTLVRASISRDIGDVVYRLGRGISRLRLPIAGLLFRMAERFFRQSARVIMESAPGGDILLSADYDILGAYGLTLSHIGKVQRELGEFEAALKSFQRVIEIASCPDKANYWLHAEALVHCARTRLKMGDQCGADEDASRAREMFELLGNQEGIDYARKIPPSGRR